MAMISNQFITSASERFSPYLSGVTPFLASLPAESERDDFEMLSTKPDLYVRNMIALAVLNRLYRKAFSQAKRRLIVLPECLKNYAEWDCAKEELENHSLCIQCQSECQISQTVDLYVDNRTELIMEPDETEKTARDYYAKHGSIGIVGVACVLTLITGFKKTLKYNHPTQGVFLNYSSCGHHWAEQPYNTRFSHKQLAQILGHDPHPSNDNSQPGETYSLEKETNTPDDFYQTLDQLSIEFEQTFLPAFLSAHDSIYAAGLAIIDDLLP